MNKKAIIIGAGPAGLTAAWELRRTMPEIDVTIIEATGRMGGLSATIEYNGNRIDMGGHRFFSKSKAINDLWNEILPPQGSGAKDDLLLGRKQGFTPGGADPEKTDLVMLIRNRVSRIFYRRKFFDYPITLKPATFINMGFIATVKAGFSYLASTLSKRPERSLEDFYINRFGKQLYRMFFEDYTEKIWGMHPSKLSPSWGSQRVKGLSIRIILKEILLKKLVPSRKIGQISLIERFLYPKLGPGQLWQTMAEKVTELGADIKLHTEVTGIEIKEGVVESVTVNMKGQTDTLACDYLFSSMPIKDLIAAIGKDVPDEIKHIACRLPYRNFITVGLLLKRLRLENRTKIRTLSGIIPDCWIYIQESDVCIGRLQIFNNWSPYIVADAEQTVWVGMEYFCNEDDEMWNMTEKDFIDFAVKEMISINIIEEEDVLDAVHVKCPKAYPAYFGYYNNFGTIRRYLDTVGNLYCIGRNGQHRYNNMDHSMLTAIEAVKLLKSGKTDKSPVWNVNTEGAYHEELFTGN
ncbi:MAG: NAD(P)/FAD-dependent oxidoreductase [Dysgonamonadaceae bacterium]|jgi:protoporphyrinogen oxidase|nr:NAD(P)/FAD-dependent oxidoreductase [Dysgonamonadaceae bacterium]